jgi:hypothetical protein
MGDGPRAPLNDHTAATPRHGLSRWKMAPLYCQAVRCHRDRSHGRAITTFTLSR